MSGTGKIWATIDPIRCKVDVYPKWVALKIEEKYKLLQENRLVDQTVPLGSAFFDATIHLSNGEYYQTTPGIGMGPRGGGKPPGFRNILPIQVVDNKFKVFGRRVYGEWRIISNERLAEKIFEETIDNPNDVLSLNDNINSQLSEITIWEPNDLLQDSDNNKYVCVWMWCRGVYEMQGNLYNLSDNWWSPYLNDQNKLIEEAFKNNQNSVEIELFDGTKRTIQFTDNFSCYAKQVNDTSLHSSQQAIRIIKRVIIKVGDLKNKIANLNTIQFDISSIVDVDNIPNEFYCAISQEVMIDPVKTVDNHTYDRPSIEKWFTYRNTSPLTGLPLSSLALVPNKELYSQIQEFIKLQIEKNK